MIGSDDIFSEVHQLVDNTHSIQEELRQWADGSLESISHWTSQTDGLLRRKPSKDNLKQSKKTNIQSQFYTNEKLRFILENNKSMRSPNVGSQLKRIEKNIMTAISKPKAEGNRQRKIMKKFKSQKENMSVSLEITPQQLQRLGEEDEQLKETLFLISRFYDKQKEKNSQLELEIAALGQQTEFAQQQLQRQEAQLQELQVRITQLHKSSQLKEQLLLKHILGASTL